MDINRQLVLLVQKFSQRTPWEKFWWSVVPGQVIEVKWPNGYTEPDDNLKFFQSADPNDHYRPELERLVGVQGWDWEWKVGNIGRNTLLIKFRRGKTKYAPYLAMKWS